jgi:threonylcarbamoyladenosine tRNA methylthiotransferase MtaB
MAGGFHVENFGCRAARADGEAVSDRLRNAGLADQPPATADVVVVNTCSVTAEADRAARAFIRRAHRLNPDARIVVTGCYAQRSPESLARLPGVAAVVGNSHKALAPEIALKLALGLRFRQDLYPTGQAEVLSAAEVLVPSKVAGFSPYTKPAASYEASAPDVCISTSTSHNALAASTLITIQSLAASSSNSAPIWADDRFAHSFLEETQLIPGVQTRPNLKIQEGCGNRCTFCVIPETRGPSQSQSAASVLKQARGFVAAGGNELVLSGINLGRWGRDLQREQNGTRPSLAGLVRQLLTTTALPRLRLSSIEPMDWDADLVALLREFGGGSSGSRLARHAHLPLQSGSDTVLRRMHRRYRPWHYAQKVAALFDAAGPELTLGADVMVGFPGETDREFQETFDFVQVLPFGYLHLFPFSPRPRTPGWDLHLQSPVSSDAVEERMGALRLLIAQKSEAHRRLFIGRELPAITLHSPATLQANGLSAALTDNFIPVELEGLFAANQLMQIRISGITPGAVLLASNADTPEGHQPL